MRLATSATVSPGATVRSSVDMWLRATGMAAPILRDRAARVQEHVEHVEHGRAGPGSRGELCRLCRQKPAHAASGARDELGTHDVPNSSSTRGWAEKHRQDRWKSAQPPEATTDACTLLPIAEPSADATHR